MGVVAIENQRSTCAGRPAAPAGTGRRRCSRRSHGESPSNVSGAARSSNCSASSCSPTCRRSSIGRAARPLAGPLGFADAIEEALLFGRHDARPRRRGRGDRSSTLPRSRAAAARRRASAVRLRADVVRSCRKARVSTKSHRRHGYGNEQHEGHQRPPQEDGANQGVLRLTHGDRSPPHFHVGSPSLDSSPAAAASPRSTRSAAPPASPASSRLRQDRAASARDHRSPQRIRPSRAPADEIAPGARRQTRRTLTPPAAAAARGHPHPASAPQASRAAATTAGPQFRGRANRPVAPQPPLRPCLVHRSGLLDAQAVRATSRSRSDTGSPRC